MGSRGPVSSPSCVQSLHHCGLAAMPSLVCVAGTPKSLAQQELPLLKLFLHMEGEESLDFRC